MPLTFFGIPVPAGDGVGAAVNVDALYPGRNITVDGGNFTGKLFIQVSQTGGVNDFVDLPGGRFEGSGQVNVSVVVACRFVRVRRVEVNGGSLPVVNIGGEPSGDKVFGTLPAPAGGTNGTGAAVDVSAGGDCVTVSVTGLLDGQLIVDGSEDGGTSWAPINDFGIFGDGEIKTAQLSAFNRLRCRLQLAAIPSPNLNVQFGTMAFASTGGGGGADWPLTVMRYFLVDNTNGSDTNLGYIDAPLGSTLIPAGIAKKTITGPAGLLSILPRTGNGRSAMVMLQNNPGGANYVDPSAVQEALDENGVSGYSRFTTRGSSDLTNSIHDRIMAGAITALAGPNGDGSFTVAAGATTSALTVAAPGNLPAEPVPNSGVDTSALGFRIRFTGNVTAALTDVCRAIQRNTTGPGTSVITYGENTTVAPAAGDTFFIERPGVRVTFFNDSEQVEASQVGTGIANMTYNVVGIATTSLAAGSFNIGSPARVFYTFCEITGPTAAQGAVNHRANMSNIIWRPQYRDDSNASRDLGIGFRGANYAPTGVNGIPAGFSAGARGMFVTGTNISTAAKTLLNALSLSVLGGCYFGGGAQLNNMGFGNALTTFGNGGAATVQRTRMVGGSASNFNAGLYMAGPAVIRGVATAGNNNACIRLGGANTTALNFPTEEAYASLDDCINDTAGGNTGVGIAIETRNASIRIGGTAACTVSGTAGEILLGDGAALDTYAALTRTNVVDSLGNNVYGSGGILVTQCKLVTVTDGSVAVGDIMRSNNSSNGARDASASSLAASGVIGVMVTPTGIGLAGYLAVDGFPSVNFIAPPLVGSICWLNTSTAGDATTTEPVPVPPEVKIRIGRVINANGNTGQVMWQPDLEPEALAEGEIIVEHTTADGNQTFGTATQTFICVVGVAGANTTYALPPLASVGVGQEFTLKDKTTAGVFNLVIDGDGAETIDNLADYTIVSGSHASITVKKMPTAEWAIV